jgi:hypothetical protein
MATIDITPPGSRSRFAHGDIDKRAAVARLDALARLFDTAFIFPGTNVRFGIEAIMRLVPGIGDAAASALSCWLLYQAHALGVAIEGVVGAVPFVGDMFDVGFRANRRNVKILQEHFEREGWL